MCDLSGLARGLRHQPSPFQSHMYACAVIDSLTYMCACARNIFTHMQLCEYMYMLYTYVCMYVCAHNKYIQDKEPVNSMSFSATWYSTLILLFLFDSNLFLLLISFVFYYGIPRSFAVLWLVEFDKCHDTTSTTIPVIHRKLYRYVATVYRISCEITRTILYEFGTMTWT